MVVGDSELYEDLGRRVARIRRSRELRQLDIAEALGVTRAAVSSIESGKQAVAIHQLLQLSSALGVHTADLVPELGETPSQEPPIHSGPDISVEQQEWISKLLNRAEEAD